MTFARHRRTAATLTEDLVRRRFLLLRGLRWLSTGLLIPVTVLLLLDRGFSLGQIGLITAAQGLTVMLLELPAGGLTDALGRRPTLLTASLFSLGSTGLFVVAESLPALITVFALQGVYRALDSGPLEAWYVDSAQNADPNADIETGLARGSTVLGLAVSAGSLASGGLVAVAAWSPMGGVDPLVLPLFGALILELVHLFAIAALMTENWHDHVAPRVGRFTLIRQSILSTPQVVSQALTMIRRDRVLLALVTVELLWGFGLTAFETFTPVRLADVVGGTNTAASILGPTQAGAWILFAAGAAAACGDAPNGGRIRRRVPPHSARRRSPRHRGSPPAR